MKNVTFRLVFERLGEKKFKNQKNLLNPLSKWCVRSATGVNVDRLEPKFHNLTIFYNELVS